MWICSRCQTGNKDGNTQCVECSAPRNARRFGAGTPVSAPSVQAAGTERRMQPQAPVEAPPPLRRTPQLSTDPGVRPGRAPGGFVRMAGLLLSLLLPLAALLLAVLRYDVVHPIVNAVFFKPTEAAPPLFGYLAYGFSALVTLLVSLVPGLALWALGHLARGVRRR